MIRFNSLSRVVLEIILFFTWFIYILSLFIIYSFCSVLVFLIDLYMYFGMGITIGLNEWRHRFTKRYINKSEKDLACIMLFRIVCAVWFKVWVVIFCAAMYLNRISWRKTFIGLLFLGFKKHCIYRKYLIMDKYLLLHWLLWKGA